jgi:non-specific serine/threonine protein kinase/serine/threonine-protein kinase
MDAAFTSAVHGATTPTANSARQTAHEFAAPTAVARYKIVRLIGEGGMGAVYEAEQEHPRRTVALKVIKPGMASPALLRRFDQEAEALGRLQHPGIAQIYEAGTADTGFGPQPYFAMEFIRGTSLTAYVRQLRLSIRQRVEMMAKVCDAVQHAHQRGLIHRDLKPGNILVDETGQPKIVDFGVTRITDKDAQATSQTDAGQLIGTLAYMSPEQVLADPLELDTRSDVYALGVILYELLAGRLPYPIGSKLHEALHAIREVDPQRLSSVDSIYRGDLETIAAKALEKDKARRYASAAELGADLRRYLTNEPIVARPPSLSYQISKFARRHTAVVAGIAAVFVVLVAGIVMTTLQAARANRERDRATAAERQATQTRDRAVSAENLAAAERDKAVGAEARAQQERDRAQLERDNAVAEKRRADNEAAIAVAVGEFMQSNMFEQIMTPTPSAGPPDGAMRAALTRAASKVEGRYAQQPLIEAGVREAIFKAYASLGATLEGIPQLERALELRRRALGSEDPLTAKTMLLLGGATAGPNTGTKKITDSKALLAEAYRILRTKLGEAHPDTLESMTRLANIYEGEGKVDDAESLTAKAVAIAQRAFGQSDERTLRYRSFLVGIHQLQGKRDQAQAESSDLYESARRALGENHPVTEAARLEAHPLQSSVPIRIITDPRDAGSARQMVAALTMQAQQLIDQKKFDPAEKLLQQALDVARKSGGQGPTMIVPLTSLASVYEGQGKYDQQESALREAVEFGRDLGDAAPGRLGATQALANAYRAHGKYAETEPLYKELVEMHRRTVGESNLNTMIAMYTLGDVYARQGKLTEAEDVFRQMLDAQQRNRGLETLQAARVIASVGWVQLQLRRLSEAEASLRQALEILNKTDPDSWWKYNTRSMLGATLAAQRKYVEAEPLLLSGYEGLKQRKPDFVFRCQFTLQQAGEAMAKFYQDSGQPEKAVAWQKLQ